jgi:hypothetical protein
MNAGGLFYGVYTVYAEECIPSSSSTNDDCVICSGENCDNPEDDDHMSGWYLEREEAEAWANGESQCGNCNVQDPEEFATLVRHLDDAVADAASIIAASDGNIWISAERGAVQGVSCAGEGVGIHIPISVQLVSELQELVARLKQAPK